MKNGRSTRLAESVPEPEQHIGHITAPLEDQEVQQIQAILAQRGGCMRKCQWINPDQWWIIILPENTVKIPLPNRVRTSAIRLADGFQFFLEEAIFTRDKSYARLPRIYFEEPTPDILS
jgi:hypothetical protein